MKQQVGCCRQVAFEEHKEEQHLENAARGEWDERTNLKMEKESKISSTSSEGDEDWSTLLSQGVGCLS